MIPEFPHKAPKGYSYETKSFKRNVVSIWLNHHAVYDYNLGKSVSTIWGFYNLKTKSYYAPVNKLKMGKEVNIQDTTPYTAMPLHLTILEKCMFQK